jgi:hypothetical protein
MVYPSGVFDKLRVFLKHVSLRKLRSASNLCQGENSNPLGYPQPPRGVRGSHIKLGDLYNLSLSSLKITPVNNTPSGYPDEKGKRKIHTLTKNKAQRRAPHSSFDTILNDKSRGGILLSKVTPSGYMIRIN